LEKDHVLEIMVGFGTLTESLLKYVQLAGLDHKFYFFKGL
jgi:16S rRNA A1518/A1519 N6-dimethyltransferase RsmA/KsgA/DIM1 with predicted DNA glycosylase/AP lyase activity